MKTINVILMLFLNLQLVACAQQNEIQPIKNDSEPKNLDTMKLKITVGTAIFSASLENNPTAKAFKERLPMTLNMADLNNNEVYADVSESLPTNPSNPKTIQNGDLMLYGSSTLVLFYKTFPTQYSYTKIGKVNNPEGLSEALGSSSNTITFEIQ